MKYIHNLCIGLFVYELWVSIKKKNYIWNICSKLTFLYRLWAAILHGCCWHLEFENDFPISVQNAKIGRVWMGTQFPVSCEQSIVILIFTQWRFTYLISMLYLFYPYFIYISLLLHLLVSKYTTWLQ